MAMEDVCVRLGKRLRILRRHRLWRLEDLSLHAGFGRTYLSNLERGKKNPSLRTLEVLAQTFGLKLSEFLREL